MIRKDPSNVEKLLTMPDGQDEGVWKYEHLRYISTGIVERKGNH